jgi:ubiquinone/menaquinone biosynthesis C-methylase UbiE
VSTEGCQDHWAAWLAERRHGGDAELLRRQLEFLAPIRDQVLANAALAAGHRVLDVGCGDGLIAFAAAEAVGSTGQVVFGDVSADLLNLCRDLASERGLLERCQFVQAPASDLSPIPDQAVDVVTLRSVLIYEPDKAAAFAEFHRVLRPGGRLSLFEPINRFAFPEPADRFYGYDIAPVADLVAKLKEVYDAIQPPAFDPMLDFDERDLVTLAEQVGFGEIHAQAAIDIRPPEPVPWDAMLNSSGNPRIPTVAEAMRQVLTADEAERLTAHLRPLVEQGRGQRRTAVAYVWALRSSEPGEVTGGPCT